MTIDELLAEARRRGAHRVDVRVQLGTPTSSPFSVFGHGAGPIRWYRGATLLEALHELVEGLPAPGVAA